MPTPSWTVVVTGFLLPLLLVLLHAAVSDALRTDGRSYQGPAPNLPTAFRPTNPVLTRPARPPVIRPLWRVSLLPHAPNAHSFSVTLPLFGNTTAFCASGLLCMLGLLAPSAWKALSPHLHRASSFSSPTRLLVLVHFLQSKALFVYQFVYQFVYPHVCCVYHCVPDIE